MLVNTRARHVARSLVCVAALLYAGCGHNRPAGATADPTPKADRHDNGVISVTESLLQGTVKGTQLTLSIPVKALVAAAGSLDVSLTSVDGAKVESQASVSYSLDAGKSTTLHATVALPKGLDTQADRALYNVRVSESRELPLRVTRSLLYVLTPYELVLEGPARVHLEKHASYRARVQDPVTHAPVQNTAVTLLLAQKGQTPQTLQGKTDDTGSAVFDVSVTTAGNYQVSAQVTDAGTQLQLVQDITAEAAGQKVLLTSDKPIYQPGQLIHVRALALDSPSNAPVQKQAVVFEIEDGKGNKVYKKSFTTDGYGIASTTFRLASVVNEGTYKLRALLGAVTSEKTVEVSHYALPKFAVTINADKAFYAPAEHVRGSVDSRYFFGKNVAGGKVLVEALTLDVGQNVFQQVMGVTDANGHMSFDITLPSALAGIPLQSGNALVSLRVTVTDTAGQEVKKEKALTVAPDAVRITLIPEATQVVPGVENRLHLFVTDPLGAPVAAAKLGVSGSLPTQTAQTDAYGHVELHWTPSSSSAHVDVTLTTAAGNQIVKAFDFTSQTGGEHVLVRTDKSVYRLGETVKVQVFASNGETRVYLDWLNEGQAVDMRTLDVQKGVASFSMPLDASLIGDNRIEAYVVDADGNTVRAGRSIVVERSGALSVSLSTDKAQYRPGDPAKLTFTVSDEQGKPAVAALGVQIVDEAVFGLIDAQPGLLRTFFELEDAFAKPQYEIDAPAVSFDKLLFEDVTATDAKKAQAAQTQAEANLAALMGNQMMGIAAGSWQATVAATHTKLMPALMLERSALIELLKPVVSAQAQVLVQQGCDVSQYYCSAINMPVGNALATQIKNNVSFFDFWGNAYSDTIDGNNAAVFVSAGPDEKPGTADDETITIGFGDFGAAMWGGGNGHGAGVSDAGAACIACEGAPGFGFNAGAASGAAGTVATPTAADPNAPQAASNNNPRVRTDFPETLYVNPSLITGADGTATVSLDMADSITSWRVSALANAAGGKLGGGQSGVTVFQDFFADVNFPAELTRGDEVDFPIVVYNYLKVAQSVQLTVDSAPWFTALGSVNTQLDLAAGEVKSVNIPVRVDQVGTQTLTVHAIGTKASDAVARSVRVIPDGLATPIAQSGALGTGNATLSTSFPVNAVPGSGQLYLDVFPAYLAQAVQGLDSLLQVPSGCFEQTTSTTWPNVLVARYMEQTKQVTPSIQLKAESLISAGYQRLLTFEHTGGGFSWFGMQDPAPYLSVTAFGLMEFADMAQVQEVDSAMRARTRQWLISQQKADGSWPGDMTESFSFQSSVARNTAFVVWALSQDGDTGPELQRGLAYVKANLTKTDDAYTLALAANAYAAAAPSDPETSSLLSQLDAMKTTAGSKFSWDSGGSETNFYCGGNDAAVATTALVTHAMLTAGGYAGTVKGALDFITGSKDKNGNFGSTQATIWSLKTLLLAALHGTAGAVGTLDVKLDGQAFASVDLSKAQSDVMTRIDMSALATAGAHTVDLAFAGTGKVSYNLVSTYNIPWAQVPVPVAGPLSIAITYDRASLLVNETVTAKVSVNNLTNSTQNMVLVTLGVPPGFEVLTDDLASYLANGQLSRFELTGKQLTLYLTALAASATQDFQYRLRATMPVKAVDGGAEVHLYYQPDQKAQSASQLLVATAN
jgi:uncharacterized protein YfaS (alpha-2-macroglobulin family)